MKRFRTYGLICVAAGALLVSGCATYRTPAAGVSVPSIAEPDIDASMKVEPVAGFPASLAVARIEAPGYVSSTARGFGQGGYSVVTTRDVETEADFEHLRNLVMVAGVAPVGRLPVSAELHTLQDLRAAAARLKADMLLVYSIDTVFSIAGTPLDPLSIIKLGVLPNREARVTATTSGVLLDVRTGYVYGLAEATAWEHQRASVWATQAAVDKSRLKAERSSFEGFLSEFDAVWKGVVERYMNPIR